MPKGIIATFPVGSRTAPEKPAPGRYEFERVRDNGLYVAIFDVETRGVNITFPVGKSTGEIEVFVEILAPDGTTREKRPVAGLNKPILVDV